MLVNWTEINFHRRSQLWHRYLMKCHTRHYNNKRKGELEEIATTNCENLKNYIPEILSKKLSFFVCQNQTYVHIYHLEAYTHIFDLFEHDIFYLYRIGWIPIDLHLRHFYLFFLRSNHFSSFQREIWTYIVQCFQGELRFNYVLSNIFWGLLRLCRQIWIAFLCCFYIFIFKNQWLSRWCCLRIASIFGVACVWCIVAIGYEIG